MVEPADPTAGQASRGSAQWQRHQPQSPQHAAPAVASSPHQQQQQQQAQQGGVLGFLSGIAGLDAYKSTRNIHTDAAKAGLKVSTEDDFELKEAQEEHLDLSRVPLCSRVPELIGHVGSGPAWYFRFVQYLWLVDFSLLLLALISFIPHMKAMGELDEAERPGFPEILFLSSYTSETRPYWQASTILAVILCFAIGPVYRWYVERERRKRERGEGVEDPFEGQYNVDTDQCVDRIEGHGEPVTYEQQQCRRATSMVIFVCVLVLQGVINYFANEALKDQGEGVAALVMSGIIKAINMAWKVLCQRLTRFERHTYWSDYRKWDCFKVFFFRLFNILVLYAVQVNSADGSYCPLRNVGHQFATIILLDITVNSFVEIVLPLLQTRCFKGSKAKSQGSDDAAKPEFILSDEYVAVCYRQYIVGLGFVTFPMIAALALVGNVLEYWLDKLRMLRISQKPKRTNNTFRTVLVAFFFVIGLAVAFGYPNGMVWVLEGSAAGYKTKDGVCSVYL